MSEDCGEAPAEAGEASEDAGSEECVNQEYMSDSNSEYTRGSEQEGKNTESQEQTQEGENGKIISLESRLTKEGTSREDIVETLKSKGYSSEEIAEIMESKESLYTAVKDMPNLPRSFFYLVRAFLDSDNIENRDVYKRISESDGTPVLFFPGLLDIPYSTEQIEEHTGLNVIRVDTRDPEEMDKIIEHAYRESGQKPVLVGFSDGRIRVQDYLKNYGREKVSEVFVIAGQKTIPNVVYIDGANDLLAPTEKGYHNKLDSQSIKIMIPDSGHVDLVYNPKSIQQIGDIITSYTRVSKGPFYSGLPKAA